MTWAWRCDTEIAFGRGVLTDLRPVLRARGGVPALLVRGRASLERSGALGRLKTALGPDLAGDVAVGPLPGAAEIDSIAESARSAGVRGFLAVGGGTAIEAAKAAAFSLSHGLPTAALLSGQRNEAPLAVPLVAVPTTAGTGAETTPWATVWDKGAPGRTLLREPRTAPAAALVDPDLLDPLPREAAAAALLDSLCHAVESYWSTRGGTVSRAFALGAVARVVAHGVAAAGGQRQAREEAAAAALLAGLAMIGAGTNVLHAVSWPLSLRRDVPHGFAAAISLPAFLRRFAGKYPRDADLHAAFKAQNAEGAAKEAERLLRALNAPARLSDVGVRAADLDRLLAEIPADEAGAAPGAPKAEEIRSALDAVL